MPVSHLPADLTIGFLTPHNPYDRRAFSGTCFFAAEALARRADVSLRILGDHRPPRMVDRVFRRTAPKLSGGPFDLAGLDAVVGMVATPLLDIVQQQHPDLPCFHITDATPTFLRDVYGWALPASAETTETRVASKAAGVIYSSQEMADRAPRDLGLPNLAPKAISFGVNFDQLPTTCPTKPGHDVIRLLFVGVDWERKGGDIAVAVLDRLLEQGRKAHLTVVGRCPNRHLQHEAITYAGFLDKNRPKAAAQLRQIYSDAHLLLLPSRSDCTPMVISEAMVHGTPVIASDVGGIRSMVGGEGSGRVLHQHASPGDWARAVNDLVCDPAAYRFMSESAYDRGRAILSWDNWAQQVRAEMVPKVLVHVAA